MSFFIRIFRIIFLFVWTLLIAVVSFPNLFRGWRGIKATSELTRIWAKGIAHISGVKIKTYGKMPDASSGLVVSNHLGYLDIIVHASLFPLRFAPSTDVAKIPIVGGVAFMSNAIFVDRKSAPAAKKAVRAFAKTMNRGMYLIVYPEGTSTDGQSGILPFKSTPFDAAAGSEVPILPILTRYQKKTGQPIVPWYGDMTFFSHFWNVLGSRSIDAEVLFLNPIKTGKRSRKEISSSTHDIMSMEWAKWNNS